MMTRVRALLWTLFAVIVGTLSYVLGVKSTLGQRAEESVLDASDFTTDPPAPLSLVSPVTLILALILISLLGLAVHGLSRALTILSASAVAILASQLLKDAWLERPDLLELDAHNTFPSGHMTVFTALVAGLLWALPRALRPIMSVFGAGLLAVVSWQLLEYGWHRPSDLLGALALVVAVYGLASWIGPRRSRRQPPSGEATVVPLMQRIIGSAVIVIALAMIAVGVLLVLVAAFTRSDVLMLNAGEIALMGASAFTAWILAILAS